MLLCQAIVYDSPADRPGSGPDEALLGRIADGDREAFLTLYEESAGGVFAYALSILKDRAEAEDVTQDTFLKIRSAAHLYRPKGKPMAWILTITKNLCLMRLRAGARTFPFREEEKISGGLGGIADLEDRLVLEKALSVLSGEDCQIIMLHAVSGLKHREIAALMGMPLSTVLSRYSRGIRKLRKELEGEI